VEVRHPPGSETAGLLLLGWLAARLERGRVRLTLEADPAVRPPGLSALTLSMTSGRRFALERAPEGLRARDRLPKGRERHWTAFGAARCEALLLGDAIPRGLLPDPAFAAALPAAAALTRRCGDLVPSGQQPQRRPTP